MKGIKSKIKKFISWLENGTETEKKIFWLAMISTVCCAVLSCIMLFIPNVLGVADDGTVTGIMHAAGLEYEKGISAGNSYFVRKYIWKTISGSKNVSLQNIFLLFAKRLDLWITGDRIFDIRFLGFAYLLFYLPAVYLIIKAALERLNYFSEMFIVSIAAVFMFADISYITYFNSFYPETLFFICLLYLFGSAMHLQKRRNTDALYIMLFAFAGSAYCFIRQYCFWVGVMGAAFCLFQFFRDRENSQRTTYLMASGLLIIAATTSFFVMKTEYSNTDKFHAMTRGVLFESDNPEKTLTEMGIDYSYSLLTDASSYEQFPMVSGEDSVLQEGFLNKYNSWKVAQYYLRHPFDMVSMFDIAIKTNLDISRDSCGNYEENASMPPGAKSIFFSAYCIYKKRSAPKTVGYFVILVIACLAISGSPFSLKKKENRKKRIYFETMLLFTAITAVQTFYHIINSGEAALAQYNCQLGICMDIMLYFLITEILTRIHILDKGGKKS